MIYLVSYMLYNIRTHSPFFAYKFEMCYFVWRFRFAMKFMHECDNVPRVVVRFFFCV